MTASAVKVWLGGEGACEIGDRDRGGQRVGVVEALLARVEASGWRADGARRWQHIRKYRAGFALRAGANHEDVHNVLSLALEAWERGCEVLAFTRDVDADRDREAAITRGIEIARATYPDVFVIGGVAKPAIEGWILALMGVRDTDDMSRERAERELSDRAITMRDVEEYVALTTAADVASLPVGCASLIAWLGLGRTLLSRAIRGA